MKKNIVAITLFCSMVAPGCMTYPSYNTPYEQPFDKSQSTRTINKDYDTVWNALIEYSTSTFFAIKNFEKDSGLLTLQFGSGHPSEFIDCGDMKSVTVQYSGSLIGMLEQYGSADLDGTMNIFVKRISPNVTQAQVNARYIFKAFDGGARQIWAFDTGGFDGKRFSGFQQNVICKPTHKAEQTILDGIEKIAKPPETTVPLVDRPGKATDACQPGYIPKYRTSDNQWECLKDCAPGQKLIYSHSTNTWVCE